MDSIIIYIVKCSFKNLEMSNLSQDDDMQAFNYNNVFKSLIKARRFIEMVGKEDGDGVEMVRRVVPKKVVKTLSAKETFHGVPLATYKTINIKKEKAEMIGSSNRFYSITVYKL